MKKVKEFSQFLRTLELIPDGIVLIDKMGKIVFVNTHLVMMFGYKEEELLNQSLEILMPEKYRDYHIGLRKSYQSQPYTRAMNANTTILGQTKNGKMLCLDIMLSPIDTSHHSYVLGAIRDVSQYKKMEKSLLQSQKRLERKIWELNSFFYNTSHNLKGPYRQLWDWSTLVLWNQRRRSLKHILSIFQIL